MFFIDHANELRLLVSACVYNREYNQSLSLVILYFLTKWTVGYTYIIFIYL